MSLKISTTKKENLGVEIDGNVWTIKPLSGKLGVQLSRAARRMPLLGEKVQNGTATEEDLDRYDEYEDLIINSLPKLLSDGTEDNKSVIEWNDSLPIEVISEVLAKVMEALGEATKNS